MNLNIGDHIHYRTGKGFRKMSAIISGIERGLLDEFDTITAIKRKRPHEFKPSEVEIYVPKIRKPKKTKKDGALGGDGGRDKTAPESSNAQTNPKTAETDKNAPTASIHSKNASQEGEPTPIQTPEGIQSGSEGMEKGEALRVRRTRKRKRKSDLQNGAASLRSKPSSQGPVKQTADGQGILDERLRQGTQIHSSKSKRSKKQKLDSAGVESRSGLMP